jgi:hypothetical protein
MNLQTQNKTFRLTIYGILVLLGVGILIQGLYAFVASFFEKEA